MAVQPDTEAIVALTTVHNRKDKTVNALASLVGQSLPDGFLLEVVVVDDGSTDGTAATVAHAFPDVTLVRGSGDLYWAGGMRYGWDSVVRSRRSEYLLVFNDDITLFDGALQRLIDAMGRLESNCDGAYAVVGAFREPGTGRPSYGGVRRSSRWQPLRFSPVTPDGSLQECETLNMNLALLNGAALDRTDFLSVRFRHRRADFDFGLRLRKSGGRIFTTAEYVGECPRNPELQTDTDARRTFVERWQMFRDVKGEDPAERAEYYRRHAGPLWPIFWALPYGHFLLTAGVRDLIRRFFRKR